MGIIDSVLDSLRKETRVIKANPWSFAVFIICGCAMGYAVGRWYDAKTLVEDDSLVRRYRVALGIAPGSPSALVELNNQELALKAALIVSKLREAANRLDSLTLEIDKRQNSGEIDGTQDLKERMDAAKGIAEEVDSSGVSADAYNVVNELEKRLAPAALAHVAMVAEVKGIDGGRTPISSLFSATGFDSLMFYRKLANEIDQMAKLLPPD
jgi:hypothetical protein